MANLEVKKDASMMREDIKRQLVDHSDKFWQNMDQLKPKDYCEIFLKMLPYGFSRVPDEKSLADGDRKRLVYEETTRRAHILSGGIEHAEDFEEYE